MLCFFGFQVKRTCHFHCICAMFILGYVPGGLKLHPDGQHIIYSVGCTVVIENTAKRNQDFLAGHSNNVSCITVSKSGRLIASGQVTHMGFKVNLPGSSCMT